MPSSIPLTVILYGVLLLTLGCERLYEMRLSKRHAAWSMARGGKEYGQGHFPFMVFIHTLLIFAPWFEAWLLQRPFYAWLAWPCIGALVLCQALRYWVIRTLGPRWNTRVIVIPDMPLVRSGPYKFLKHPNYIGVAIEGIALPLVHTAWLTAVIFTLANLGLMRWRLRCENQALLESA